MIQRAEVGKETLVFIVIVGGGIAAGLATKTLLSLALAALLLGVVLNGYLLVGLAFRTGKAANVPLAALGAIPAGAYDAVKIFAIGLVAQATIGLRAERPGSPVGFVLLHLALLLTVFLLMLNGFLRGAKKTYIDLHRLFSGSSGRRASAHVPHGIRLEGGTARACGGLHLCGRLSSLGSPSGGRAVRTSR